MRKLYKPGTMTTVWGIDCDFKDFASDEVDSALVNGWFISPLVFDAKEEQSTEEKPKARRGRKPKAVDDGNDQE